MKTNKPVALVATVIALSFVCIAQALILTLRKPVCKAETKHCNAFVKNAITGLVCVFDSTGIVATFYDSSNHIGRK